LPEIFVVQPLSRQALRQKSEGLEMPAKRDFTDRFLKSVKPAPAGKRIIHWDAQVSGFGIRVSDKSHSGDIGSFVLVGRMPGKASPTARRIGSYPAMSLAQARQVARAWREEIGRGFDPKVREAERLREEARRHADTFGAAFAAYADERLGRLRTGAEAKRSIERHVIAVWESRPISEIRRVDVKELIRGIHKNAPVASNRLLALLKTFFAWAAEEELIEASPAAAVKPPADEVKRDRVLTDSEIRVIWQACNELGAFGRAFRFMLATGQRRSEVGEMTWSEIDQAQRLWTLPRERTKANRAHEIPLSDLALSIIGECPRLNEFVFSTGRSTPISGWSKAKAALDKIALEKGKAKIAEWHLHDLRRTCATNLAKLGTDRIVISKILNHAEAGVTSVYDRHQYDHEKSRVLDRWGKRLQAIVVGTDGGSVVAFATARG
jgi:integrase